VLDGNGNLAFPLIGNVPTSGMTLTELQRAIATKLDPDYLHDPSVNVEVASRRPSTSWVRCRSPAAIPNVTDMTVLNAIATAGGQTYRANMGRFYIKRQVDGQVCELSARRKAACSPAIPWLSVNGTSDGPHARRLSRLPQRRPSLRTATHSLLSAHISALVTRCLVEFVVLGMRDCNCPSVASNR